MSKRTRPRTTAEAPAEAMAFLVAQLTANNADRRWFTEDELRATAFLRRLLPRPYIGRVRAVAAVDAMEAEAGRIGKRDGFTPGELQRIHDARRSAEERKIGIPTRRSP